MDINLSCPPNNQTGYGLASTYILKELILSGHNVSLFPIGNIGADDQLILDVLKQANNKSATYNRLAPSLRIYHQFSLAQHVGRRLHVGFPIFELNSFNKVERHHIEQQDRLFVCSEWAKNVITGTTSQNDVQVIPLGFDSQLFNTEPSLVYERDPGTECVFINIGKWEKRKGHDILYKAFATAFEPSDKVELWMMCDNIFYSRDENDMWRNKYRLSKMSSKIKFIPRLNTHADVISVMKNADVGVWPARAEGWNMELLEMMSLGKHVIATNYSGHTEFVNDSNCHLINIEELETANDGKWFHGQGEWASLDGRPFDSLVQTMRDIYKSRKFLEPNYDGIMTGRKFSWKNTINKIIQHLS